jgi:RNA polymerase sigma-70 factor (ECF subfamily)
MIDEAIMDFPAAYARALTTDPNSLTSRLRSGDEDAFFVIFEQHNRFIFRFVYGMVGDRGLAEELTQETFLGAYRNRATLRDGVKPSTWLYAIAKNLSRDSLRSRRREKDQATIEDSQIVELRDDRSLLPDAQLLNKELSGVIREALADLDEDKRLVFTLKVLRQFSYEEMAEITGFSVPKLKSSLHRARLHLRRRVQTYLEANDEM